ncbi:MAG: FAD-dependent oxidoreductase [Opitutales bacterium]|nr:FAD-dependent oxidoreductase [Opitutales bacterium]
MHRCQTIIIGGGMSGLACARALEQANHDWMLFEASDRVGGRVKTDCTDGFLLDHGFQVLLTAYPEARALLNYEALSLRAFAPGARVRTEAGWTRVGDPSRRPSDLLPTLFSPAGSPRDKLSILGWRRELAGMDVGTILAAPEETAESALRRRGFSETMLASFLRPFFRGIFLDPGLTRSSRLLDFVFKMFAEGDAALPAEGMEAIPRQLAAHLPVNRIRCNQPAAAIDRRTVILADGQTLGAENIVVATEADAACRLLPGLDAPPSFGVWCDHFRASALPPHAAYLHLCGKGRINNIAVPSAVQPGYAPRGTHLVSVTSLDEHPVRAIHDELTAAFGPHATEWEHIHRRHIPAALPARRSLEPAAYPLRVDDGLYIAGDHRALPTLNSALATGRAVARTLIARLPSG